MKKNTIIRLVIVSIIAVIGRAIYLIGAWNDINGFDWKGFLELFNSGLSFMEAHSVAVRIVAVVLVVAVYFIWLYHTIEKDRRETEKMSWFDANRRITDYAGGVGRFNELYKFFGQGGPGLSWWAIAGVAGIGKTRLVIEALRSEELSNADVVWLNKSGDYKEEKIEELAKKTLKKVNNRNYILADDVQLYMDSIGKLIEHFADKSADEIGNHEIRILLLIRVGEDENLENRYKQLVSKVDGAKINAYRYNYPKTEMKIQKYIENDIEKIVRSYVVKTKKYRKEKALSDEQLEKIQKTSIQVLKKEEVDSKHMRPLFAMFIADALLMGQAPMAWDRIRVLEYATVEREEEFLKKESNYLQKTENSHVFDKIRGIVCLSIIRNGMDYSELKGIKKDLKKELALNSIHIKDFLKDMQLLGKDDIIRTDMPDILSEYYVLRTLVIEPDDEVLKWVITKLCDSLDGADVIRKKIYQDFNYLYDELEEKLNIFYNAFFAKCSNEMAFDITTRLVDENDFHDSNIMLFHRAIEKQIKNKVNGKKLSIVLFNMLDSNQNLEEKRWYLVELGLIVDDNHNDDEIALSYCSGLVNMINRGQDLKEKRWYLVELERVAEDNDDNDEIAFRYCSGIFNIMIIVNDLKEERWYLVELERVAEDNDGNDDIALVYCTGLVNMINRGQDLKEKRWYLVALELMAENYGNNDEIAIRYSQGLFNIIHHAQDLKEKREYLETLRFLANNKNDNEEIGLMYCKGLCNMRMIDEERYDYYISEIYRLLSNEVFRQYVAKKEPNLITYTRRELLEYESLFEDS